MKIEVAWFVKTIFFYFLDALLNEQYETKSVTEGEEFAEGVRIKKVKTN